MHRPHSIASGRCIVSRRCFKRISIGLPRRNTHGQLRYSTNPLTPKVNHEATDIAVLGGGITGLASAYYLSRSLPDVKITLFEASSRLGGWLHSNHVDVSNGSIVFEQGPRNLRPSVPNGLITLELVCCQRQLLTNTAAKMIVGA